MGGIFSISLEQIEQEVDRHAPEGERDNLLLNKLRTLSDK